MNIRIDLYIYIYVNINMKIGHKRTWYMYINGKICSNC